MRVLCCFIFVLFIEWTYADCGVVSKKEWDGLAALQVEYLPRPINLVIIEHTVTPFCETTAKCKERIRNIQDYMMDNFNFPDIGYSFMVGGDGKVYEGVGWLHVGAHTYGYNRKSIGIAFIGNYNNDTPTSQQLEAVKQLLKCGVEQGHLTANFHVIGHKQVLATESPGRKLYNEIRRWPQWLDKVDQI
ncbi:peptidoglycan recognition protein [Manduca sexta]|uniref:Peptidoglycan-recognition protein n=1 Tax=Manduca sexta TaxID=7130 RepID=A0A922CUX1_MANSE|nr:peptidoglycan recognition protein [Manduca sexta]KAG6458852.1 hypothetical protein O3G_MSEX011088 [Manduca sexta]KAG6458853.1 hypothetical protein O3G_MSEX011088 [Manduca sexta]